jgi:hypothetical protein
MISKSLAPQSIAVSQPPRLFNFAQGLRIPLLQVSTAMLRRVVIVVSLYGLLLLFVVQLSVFTNRGPVVKEWKQIGAQGI